MRCIVYIYYKTYTMRLTTRPILYKMYTMRCIVYIYYEMYSRYYKTYTMKLMLHIYYDIYDKTNIYTFRCALYILL